METAQKKPRKQTKRKPIKRAPVKVQEAQVEAIVEEAVEYAAEIKTEPKPIAKFAEKKKRIPIGLRDPLAVDTSGLDTVNFYNRHVRGTKKNIQRYLDAGYEFVEADLKVGDPNIAKPSSMGSLVTGTTGDSEERTYLMRLPMDLYLADQAAKAAKIDAIEAQLHQRPKDAGLEGEIKLNR